jgi:hypothetical protein
VHTEKPSSIAGVDHDMVVGASKVGGRHQPPFRTLAVEGNWTLHPYWPKDQGPCGIPTGDRLLRLSKLARVVTHFPRRLQAQERLTTEVAKRLVGELHPKDGAIEFPTWLALAGQSEPGEVRSAGASDAPPSRGNPDRPGTMSHGTRVPDLSRERQSPLRPDSLEG